MIDLNHLPHPAERNIAVHIKPAAERNVRSGHPWLFADSIRDQSREGQPGDLAVIFDRKKRFLAVGLYDPASPIRVKILHHGKPTTINQDFYRDKFQEAATLRAPLAATETNGYRLLHGESDGLPGLVVDRYAETLVLKLYTAAWLPHLRAVLPALDAVLPAERWVLRLSRALQAGESHGLHDGHILRGAALEGDVVFLENGLRFAADVRHGHKTGFFFDQRENRQRVRTLSAGQAVLDVFAYNGGFSVYAAAGGASSVLSLDISEPALASARRNMALNEDKPQVAACEHEVLAADAFEGLQMLHAQGRRYGLVVVDPPSFAKSERDVPGALRAYARLVRRAVPLVQPGGTLVMASCSSRVSADDFFQTVQRSSPRPLIEIDRSQHALDHPLRPSFPEGAYLKCLFARVP